MVSLCSAQMLAFRLSYNTFLSDSFPIFYDGTDYSEPATFIEVSEVNDKPIAMADHFMIAEDDTLRGNLMPKTVIISLIYEYARFNCSVTLNVISGT